MHADPSNQQEVVAIGHLKGVRFEYRAPYHQTDAGRAGSRRPRQKNDCTVRAVALTCDSSYDEAYDALHDAGRKCARGFAFRPWARTARLNGYRFTWIPFPAIKGEFRMNPPRFAVEHPTGRFILRTAGHVWACLDGVLCDNAHSSTIDPHRCVYGAWAVTPEAEGLPT